MIFLKTYWEMNFLWELLIDNCLIADSVYLIKPHYLLVDQMATLTQKMLSN